LVRESAAKTARAAKTKAKQAEEMVNELNRQMAMVRPSEEDQKKMQDAVREANRVYQEAVNIPDPPDLSQLHANALDLIQKSNQWQAEEKRIAEIANVPENRLVSLQASLHAILGVYVDAGGSGRCLICDGTVAADPEVLQNRRKKIEGDAKLEAERKAALAELDRVRAANIRAYNTAQQAIQSYQNAEKAAGEGRYDTSATDKQERIRKAYAALTEVEKASKEMHQEVGRWDKVQEARQQSVVAKRESKDAEELSSECQKVADQLINAGRAGFVARVQKFLPPTDVFDLILQEGKREVCIFGFRRGTMIQSALSGAEWARLTIALAAAVLDAKPPTANTIAVLTPEERAFDSRTLAAVMRALVNAPGQVILTSPLAPKKEDQPALVESGWTILKISKKGDAAEGSAAGAD
jgi:ribosome-associated protein YbcJ (S4-like RNA binding protein)